MAESSAAMRRSRRVAAESRRYRLRHVDMIVGIDRS
jgi:hypothetical protein